IRGTASDNLPCRSGSDDAMGAHREFVGGRPRFGRCCRELAKNSPEICWEVHQEFADRLSGARRELAGRMLGVRRKKSGAYRGFIGRISRVHWEFAKRSIDGQIMKIVY
ncbi:hypothetical protein BHE74_00056909, partial [Ensete ventricosum]